MVSKENPIRLYEALFLLQQADVAGDFPAAVEHVRDLFNRAGAELLMLRKWDERRLAYEIKGQKRGTFLLAYFRAAGTAIRTLEHDSNLSETVLRMQVIKGDHIGEVELEAARKDADLSLEVKLRSEQAPSQTAPSQTAPSPEQAAARTAPADVVTDKPADAGQPVAAEGES